MRVRVGSVLVCLVQAGYVWEAKFIMACTYVEVFIFACSCWLRPVFCTVPVCMGSCFKFITAVLLGFYGLGFRYRCAGSSIAVDFFT